MPVSEDIIIRKKGINKEHKKGSKNGVATSILATVGILILLFGIFGSVLICVTRNPRIGSINTAVGISFIGLAIVFLSVAAELFL